MLPWFCNRFPLYLAPMAGFTDIAYRMLCKEQGADVLVSEFVLADALVREVPSAWNTIRFYENQRPVGIQIFGSNPETMAQSAVMIRERLNPDFIDLNFGCPSSRITDIHAGSSLLRDIDRLAAIAEAVVKAAAPTPVTAKMRIGWDNEHITALETGIILENSGIQAVAIHGRTKEQGYSGSVNWEIINKVASTLKIPVIGNGNIRHVADVEKIRKETDISGVMIGRAAQGNPWIFKQIKSFEKTGILPTPPTPQERFQMLLRYAQLLIEHAPEKRKQDIGWAKARLKTLIRDIPGGNKMKQLLDHIRTHADLESMVASELSKTHGA